MPSRSEHLLIARNNRAFAENLVGTFPNDATALQWATTAAFYCGLHCLEAHLASQNIHSRSHIDRDTHLTAHVGPRVFRAYRYLRQRSEAARYQGRAFTVREVQNDVLGQFLPVVTSFVGL